jgi:predicted DNA-binding protein (MmcQ/YjbR family)
MKNSLSQSVAAELRTYALSFPESNEEFPWGESAFKVKGKVFLFMRTHEEGVSLSVKLPQSNATALDKGFAQPTGYGLGKSGWVTCSFEGGERVPIELLKPWIMESWRAVAPKTLVKRFDGGASSESSAASAAMQHKPVVKSSPKSKTTLPAKLASKAGKTIAGDARKVVKTSKGASRKSDARGAGGERKAVKSVAGSMRKATNQRARKRS